MFYVVWIQTKYKKEKKMKLAMNIVIIVFLY